MPDHDASYYVEDRLNKLDERVTALEGSGEEQPPSAVPEEDSTEVATTSEDEGESDTTSTYRSSRRSR